jgi:chorismate mutase
VRTPTASPAANDLPDLPDPPADTARAIADGRARIDDIDRAIADLVLERAAVSRMIQAARRATGGGRIAHSRELEVVAHYTDKLGRPGAAVALALLDVCRGRR